MVHDELVIKGVLDNSDKEFIEDFLFKILFLFVSFCLLTWHSDIHCYYSGTVTGICYVSATKTVWIAAGTPEAPMYDPKSGDNVRQSNFFL